MFILQLVTAKLASFRLSTVVVRHLVDLVRSLQEIIHPRWGTLATGLSVVMPCLSSFPQNVSSSATGSLQSLTIPVFHERPLSLMPASFLSNVHF